MWGSKRGSILYSILVLILCSTILVRNHRLFRSHIYIERGIYSMDVRVHAFTRDLSDMEAFLGERYSSAEELMVFLRQGRQIFYKDFTISHDSSYNGHNINMISIIDRRILYQRRVMVLDDEGQIRLLPRGV